MVTARPVDHPTSGPNWLLIGGALAIVVIVAVVAFLVLASGSGNSNASGNVVTAPTEVVATPTVAPTEVPPTPTPVPPTAFPTKPPIPSREELTANLPNLKAMVDTITVNFSVGDRQNVNQAFTDAAARLGQTDKARIQSSVDLLANALYIVTAHGCKSAADTITPPVFKQFRQYVLDLSDRLWAEGMTPSDRGTIAAQVLRQMNDCQNPLMKQ